MSDIVLSAATRQNLLAAQNTSDLLSTTQNRLATGKKVNSALDNPLNFFTSAALDSRAGDISTLLDSISNGVQTIQAAATGITNIQKLVDSAKSTANQALSTTLSTVGTAGTAYVAPGTGGSAVTFKVNGTAVSGTIAASSTASAAATYLNGLTGVPSGTFGVDTTGHITVNASADVEITDATTRTALGFAGTGTNQATELTVTGADTRSKLAAQFNDLLTQIDQLAGDSSYNGVNLLNSAATSNKLHISFNEKDTSNLDVQGVSAKSAGLGLTAVDVTAGGTGNFVSDTDVKATLTKLTSATTTLRSYSSTFGSNLTVVQNRQDFSKHLINVLQTGSSNLTSADLNEEAANSQALSTRQSLAISALSLANQSQQSVLQLLR